MCTCLFSCFTCTCNNRSEKATQLSNIAIEQLQHDLTQNHYQCNLKSFRQILNKQVNVSLKKHHDSGKIALGNISDFHMSYLGTNLGRQLFANALNISVNYTPHSHMYREPVTPVDHSKKKPENPDHLEKKLLESLKSTTFVSDEIQKIYAHMQTEKQTKLASLEVQLNLFFNTGGTYCHSPAQIRPSKP